MDGQHALALCARRIRSREMPGEDRPAIDEGFAILSVSSELREPLHCTSAKWRFANARPDPDFRYFSKRTASRSVANSLETTIDQGRCRTVWPQRPPLCDPAVTPCSGANCSPIVHCYSGSVLRAVMQDEELLRLQRKLRVGLALIVGEFDFIRTVEDFHNSAHLPTKETVRG